MTPLKKREKKFLRRPKPSSAVPGSSRGMIQVNKVFYSPMVVVLAWAWANQLISGHFWICRCLESRKQKFSEQIWRFLFLRPNLYSVTKIELICQNWLKIGFLQAISRVPENFWKFPGLMEYLNLALKIKFLDKSWVGKIPHTLKLVQISQFQGPSGFLDAWNPG